MKGGLVLIVGAILGFSSQAAADDFQKSARSGQKSLMRQYANFNILDCSPHAGKVSVVKQPANGTLSTAAAPYIIDINRFTGTRSRCAGKRVIGLNVYYTPNRGFRGTDQFTVRAIYREGSFSATDRFTVEVR